MEGGLENLDAFDMDDYEQYAAEALARSENLIEQRGTVEDEEEEYDLSYQQKRRMENTEEEEE